jgi:hypothetical protein
MSEEQTAVRRGVVILKRGLLAFWSVWWTVVLATNIADGAKALDLLGEGWAFASGNYRFLTETTARYGPPPWLNGLLFLGVILWEGVAAGLFWRAWWRFGDRVVGRRALYAAFTVGLMLWGAFLIADEVCIAYAVAGTHVRLFTAQLLTLLAVEVLPEKDPSSASTNGRRGPG